MMDYRSLKDFAKVSGYSVNDLLALAPQNDPFYVGTNGQMELAEWFAGLWEKFGYQSGIHLRRIHYQIISQAQPILLPNGKPYENSVNCSATLDCASKYARYLGLVDPSSFEDRQCGPPIVNVRQRESSTGVYVHRDDSPGFSFPELPGLPDYVITGFEAEQRYHLEVWIEKSTTNDVLFPICERYQATLVAGKGELSITHVRLLIDRLRKFRRPCRIFYISDFDPGGQSMPVAVARKIEFFMNNIGGGGGDVRLFPIALTREQCEKYQLPRTPIKPTEKRAARFEARFGEGATELDALEALHPGALSKIISEAMDLYFHHGLDAEVADAEEDYQEALEEIRDRVLIPYREEITRFEEDYAKLKREFRPKMQELADRWQNLSLEVKDDLHRESFSLSDNNIPEAEEAQDDDGGLYDSNRDYLEQLNAYKAFQGKKAVRE